MVTSLSTTSMDANMYNKILKCDYEFHEKFWSEISSNAKVSS